MLSNFCFSACFIVMKGDRLEPLWQMSEETTTAPGSGNTQKKLKK